MGIFTKTNILRLAACILKELKASGESITGETSSGGAFNYKAFTYPEICNLNKKYKSDVVFEAVSLLKSKGHIQLNDDKVFLKDNLQIQITPEGVAAANRHYYNFILVAGIFSRIVIFLLIVYAVVKTFIYYNSDQ